MYVLGLGTQRRSKPVRFRTGARNLGEVSLDE